MTVRIVVIGIFLIISNGVTGQSDWTVFANTSRINGITTHDSRAYVSTQSGLLIIDQNSGEERFITTDDTVLEGSVIRQTVGINNGHFWLSNSIGTIYYSDGEIIEPLIDMRPSQMLHYENKLWFVSSGRLFSYEEEVETHYDAFPRGVEYIFINNADELWVQVEGCLAQYDGTTITNKIVIDEFQDIESVEGYYIDKYLNHWLCIVDDDKNYTIKVYRNGEWSNYSIGVNIYFKDFFEDDINDIVFSQRNVIGKINSNEVTLDSAHLILPQLAGGIAELHHIDSDNAMWLSYMDHAEATRIFKVSPGVTIEYGLENPFLTAFPRDLQKDCDNNIYCVSGETALKYDSNWTPVQVNIFNESCELRELSFNPNSCEVWAFSNKADCSSMWNLSDESAEEVVLTDSYCYSYKYDNNGMLYAKCNNRLVRIDIAGTVHPVEEPGAPRYISNFTIGKFGRIWATGFDADLESKLFKYNNETWTSYDYEENETLIMYEDSNEHLWIIDYLEILSLDPITAVWTKHEDLEAFFNIDIHHIHDIIEDADNNFWFGSIRGLVFWDREEIITYDIHNSDIHSNSMGNLNIAGDYLWMMHSNGVTRMKLDLMDTPTQNLKNSNVNYSIYPNPSSGTVFLTNALQDRIKIEIFTVEGDLISSQVGVEAEYRLDLEAGVYLIRLSGANGQTTQKVVLF